MNIMPCPFCDYTDVEFCEVEPGRFAIDCPECECIGPFADDIETAIQRWNAPHDKSLKLDLLVREAKQWQD